MVLNPKCHFYGLLVKIKLGTGAVKCQKEELATEIALVHGALSWSMHGNQILCLHPYLSPCYNYLLHGLGIHGFISHKMRENLCVQGVTENKPDNVV